MTQIRQFHQTETKVREFIHELISPLWLNNVPQARKDAVPKPTVKFYNIQDKFFPTSTKEENPLNIEDGDDSWLDEGRTARDTEDFRTAMASGGDIAPMSPISLISSSLATFLANDKPEDIVLLNSSLPLVSTAVDTKLHTDNDFSMSF